MQFGNRAGWGWITVVVMASVVVAQEEDAPPPPPFTIKDIAASEKLFDLSDAGTTILVSTHYMDEAERCHQLAILETGRLRNQGTPRSLLAQLHNRVVEISGSDLRHVKDRALQLPGVQSAAQQGLRLRVLLAPDTTEPVHYLRDQLRIEGLLLCATEPSLEDVFVASTHTGEDQ